MTSIILKQPAAGMAVNTVSIEQEQFPGIGMNKSNEMKASMYLRRDNEPPAAIAKHGWQYHHIGIPTRTPTPGEVHLPELKIHVSGFESSLYGIQWMRYDTDAPYPEIVKTVPHVAFAVDNLAAALEGQEILIPPNSPSAGVSAAMILENGAPVELIEFAGASVQNPSKS